MPRISSALLFCAALAAQEPGAGLDVVYLRTGEQLTGRITAELEGYVEIQLAEGATVGLSRAQVQSVARGAVTPAPPPRATVAPRDEWFVLRDAHGEAVGWLHAAVTVAPNGHLTVHEEYEFAQGARRFQVTSQAEADADLRPLRCYFRERTSEPQPGSMLDAAAAVGGDRLRTERIVEGEVIARRLRLQRLDQRGRTERDIDWPDDASFPLLARLMWRQGIAASAAGTPTTTRWFDPATEEFQQRRLEALRPRTVAANGERSQVAEWAEASEQGRNAEWLDADGNTLRRELAGPGLVAVRASVETARSATAQTARSATPQTARSATTWAREAAALLYEPAGSFGLWVPNPAWQPAGEPQPGQLALHCAAHGATITLGVLDHLDADASLETAVEAVANWWRLLHPGQTITGRESLLVRGHEAVRLRCEHERAALHATLDVIAHGGRILVLRCESPAAVRQELAPDFALVQRSLELQPAAPAASAGVPEPRSLPPGGSQARRPQARRPADPASPASQPVVAPRREPPPQVRVVID